MGKERRKRAWAEREGEGERGWRGGKASGIVKDIGEGRRGKGRRGKDGESETGNVSKAGEAGRGERTGMERGKGVGNGGVGKGGRGQARPGRANPAKPLPVPGPGTRRAAGPRSWLQRRLRGPRGSGRGGRCPGRRRLRSPGGSGTGGGSAPGQRGERGARPGPRRHLPQPWAGNREPATENRHTEPRWIWRRRCPSGSWRQLSPRCRCSRCSTPPISSSPSSTSSTSPVSAALGPGEGWGQLWYRCALPALPRTNRFCHLPVPLLLSQAVSQLRHLCLNMEQEKPPRTRDSDFEK